MIYWFSNTILAGIPEWLQWSLLWLFLWLLWQGIQQALGAWLKD